ncbi:polysaccharide biosynthesis/export family protein [Sinomicrobium sp. FJxs]|uniref:Polysaccharide biosynthesis/export family protein n=2 Tax=Sinomicrobium weinanense TaxID=2842200 RepID=A0A926JVI2_9FLAO|nr:polysaccharide biosynthesis/export family protein [Sinomicrobium weinanense]MBU3123703.1 polysaccharide biosynthesis/export family protein [Sinomicrobium weinanense]
MTSCASRKNIVYFQDIEDIDKLASKVIYDPVLQPDDLLTITVSAVNRETVELFNLPVVAFMGADGVAAGRTQYQTYLVDNEGNIEFPVIGTVQLGGLTRKEAINLLRGKISHYVKDPIVNIRIMNYKVTVLGEVARPGSYTIPNERITIPEALGLAGDLTVYGKRDNILVIRDKNGQKTYTRVDLTKKDMLESPYYYLQQNDVIYVEPNGAQVQASAYNRNASVIVSVASIIISLISILTR